MAFTKKQKQDLVSQYGEWLDKSQAVFLMEYDNITVNDIEALRAKVREAGGEAHIVKNTLLKIALENTGIEYRKDMVGTTLAGFAFDDIPVLAKAFSEAAKNPDQFKFKTGFLEKRELSIDEIKSLAELPPLPVMRATLLGMLQAPAGQLVRIIAEPARQVASVVKSYSEKEAAPAA